ncbi:hypothetical protein DSM112329_00259 [Paraconexibacter sp. AEG42_29]|uniref:DUF2892 domain-containing protein n=1 Tax=Paraconexibacter sp. AEG42_29 TaxID=2997339 RepID=A0AAU7APL5_9ACTN
MSDASATPTTPPAEPAPPVVTFEDVGKAEPVAGPPTEPAAPWPPAPTGPSKTERLLDRTEVLLDKGARQAGRGLRVIVRELSERRGLRTVLLGLLITLLGLHLGSGSALSVPLIVLGVGMLIVGAMGPRLRGHVGLDFGPEGTAITMHTHIAPPGRRLAAEPGEASVIQLPPRPHISLVPTTPRKQATDPAQSPPEAVGSVEPADADVVESTGETVEIDVAQLRKLLADADRAAG